MITAEQKLARANKIGSSDAAAVLGLDPYRSAADVFLEKTGQVEGFEGNEATERGNLLEPVLIEFARRQLNRGDIHGSNFETNGSYTHESGLLIANLDGAIVGPCSGEVLEIIEAKSTVDPEGWGEELTDQVPERVLVQVAHQFVCVPSAQIAWVPVLIPGYRKFDFRLYRVERNAELCAAVESAGIDFMQKYVLPNVQPDDYRPSLEVLKRVKRQPNKIVPVADELVIRYLATTAAAKAAIENKEKASAYLLAAMGDAEGATYSAGNITYMTTKRAGYSVEATEFRQLRVKPNKGESK